MNLSRGRRLLIIAVAALGLVTVVPFVIASVLYEQYRVPSGAMAPTLQVEDRMMVRDDGDAQVGDVVVLRPPAGATEGRCGAKPPGGAMCARALEDFDDTVFVKRLVAGPGDTLAMRPDGRVVRNGEALDEDYIRACEDPQFCDFPTEITVPEGTYYALGDNRGESDDSRFWGPVPEDAIIGSVAFRYWPPSRWGGV